MRVRWDMAEFSDESICKVGHIYTEIIKQIMAKQGLISSSDVYPS